MSISVPLYGFGASGGAGGTLTVTTPGAGITVTVSKDGKTKTKDADSSGVAVFKGLESGDWTVTMTDGSQTATQTVTVTTEYALTLTFFAATIHVAYPAGSTCTATDGVTTLTAPDTSGTWACVVPNSGTWTVTATDGTDTDSASVPITEDGQSEGVELSYIYVLYDRGNQYTERTGGWGIAKDSDNCLIAHKGTYINLGYGDLAFIAGAVYTNNKLNFPVGKYKTLKVLLDYIDPYEPDGGIGLSDAKDYDMSGFAYKKTLTAGSNKEVALDISGANGAYYVKLTSLAKSGAIYKIWLE